VAPASDPAERREEELVSIVPRDPRRPYKMRAILGHVLDRGSIFELGAAFGRPTITCLARPGGRPVGVLASDPEHYGGGVTGDAADKTARFVDVCDQFHLPVVNFVDVPGFVIGSAAERAGTIRRGARGLFSVMQASVPWVSILVRKVYGVAGAGHGDGSRLNLRFAWPSGNWGSLPMAGGLEAAYRRELEAADDPAALRAEIAARLEAVTSPSVPPSASASRRSSTRATLARSCATGPSARTSWSATSCTRVRRRGGCGRSCAALLRVELNDSW
jgi:acetyl-CoA carboxylase carboxyltransferase component